MSFCIKCGNQLNDDSAFCSKCGTKVESKATNICSRCGAEMEDGMLFCSKCGTKITNQTLGNTGVEQIYTPPQQQYTTQQFNSVPNPIEQELYSKNWISLNTALTTVSGKIIITNKKITFKPMAIYHAFHNEVIIAMSEVDRAEKGGGLGFGLSIYTNAGKKYFFNMGIQNTSEIQSVVDLINNNKG